MTEPLTAYALARVLRRDRQTVQRVVDRLVPDDLIDDRPCWHVERVSALLDMTPCERSEAGRARDRYGFRDRVLDGMLVQVEKQILAIKGENSPDKCHAMAFALAPLLSQYEVLYLSTGRSLHIDDTTLGFNIDFIMDELIGEIAEAARLDSDSFFAEMNATMASAHADCGKGAA